MTDSVSNKPACRQRRERGRSSTCDEIQVAGELLILQVSRPIVRAAVAIVIEGEPVETVLARKKIDGGIVEHRRVGSIRLEEIAAIQTATVLGPASISRNIG